MRTYTQTINTLAAFQSDIQKGAFENVPNEQSILRALDNAIDALCYISKAPPPARNVVFPFIQEPDMDWTCDDCRYRSYSKTSAPCAKCHGGDHWEPV